MSKQNANTKRIIGGASDTYDKPPYAATQAQKETLPIATTRRIFRGPKGTAGLWSYQYDVTAGGAGSSLKFYFSDLPDPQPGTAAHWKDSGIAAIDLTVTATGFATRATDYPEWIMVEAIVAVATCNMWMYVRVADQEQ